MMYVLYFVCLIFFFKQKTAYERLISDLSSDVSSTDLSAETMQDIERIMQLWAEARARFGGEGDFLFGEFGAADIMFAPVVTRFITYSLPVARFAQSYMQAVISHPFMQEWIGGAQAEDWVIERFEKPVE